MPVSHVGLTVTNLPIATSFFLNALGPLGYKYIGTKDDLVGLGVDQADFFLSRSEQGPNNCPTHIAFEAAHKRGVKDFYINALTAGATGAGYPSYRGDEHEIYNAAVVDHDLNTIEVVYYRRSKARNGGRSSPNKTAPQMSTAPSPIDPSSDSRPDDLDSKRGSRYSSMPNTPRPSTDGRASRSGLNTPRPYTDGEETDATQSTRVRRRRPPQINTDISADADADLRSGRKSARSLKSQPSNKPGTIMDAIVDVATGAAAACMVWKQGQMTAKQPTKTKTGPDIPSLINMWQTSRTKSKQNLARQTTADRAISDRRPSNSKRYDSAQDSGRDEPPMSASSRKSFDKPRASVETVPDRVEPLASNPIERRKSTSDRKPSRPKSTSYFSLIS